MRLPKPKKKVRFSKTKRVLEIPARKRNGKGKNKPKLKRTKRGSRKRKQKHLKTKEQQLPKDLPRVKYEPNPSNSPIIRAYNQNVYYFTHPDGPFGGADETYQHKLTSVGKQIFKKNYIGTFPWDQVLYHLIALRQKADLALKFMIINTEDQTKPGMHWLALCLKDNHKLFLYDTFGRKANNIVSDFCIWASQADFTIREAKHDAEQSDRESSCGQRCMAWLCVCQQFSPEQALKI